MPNWSNEWLELLGDEDGLSQEMIELLNQPSPRRILIARRRVQRIHTNGALGTGVAGGPGTVPTFGYPIPTMQSQPSISNHQFATQLHFNRPPNFDTKARKILDRCDSKTDLQTLFGFGSVSNTCENSTINLANQRASPSNQSTVLFRNPNYSESNISDNVDQLYHKPSKFTAQLSTSIVSNDLGADTSTGRSTSDFSTVPASFSTQFRHPFITPPGMHDRPRQIRLVEPTGQGFDFRTPPTTSQPFFDFSHPNSQIDRSRQAGSSASPHTNTFTHSFGLTPQQQSSFGPTHFGISTQPIGTTSQTTYLHPSTSFQQYEHAGLTSQLNSTLQDRRNVPEISSRSLLGQPSEEHNFTTPNFASVQMPQQPFGLSPQNRQDQEPQDSQTNASSYQYFGPQL